MLRFKLDDVIATVCKVYEVNVREGDDVHYGEDLFSLEAQKMTTTVKANFEGRIISLSLTEGDYLNPGTVLMEAEGKLIEQSEYLILID